VVIELRALRYRRDGVARHRHVPPVRRCHAGGTRMAFSQSTRASASVKFVGRTKPPLLLTHLRGITAGGGGATGRSQATAQRVNGGRRGRSEAPGGRRGGFYGGERSSTSAHSWREVGVAAWPSGSARRLGNPRHTEGDDRRWSRRHKIR
jgi:hypothetical protein